jgi:hypothetical protein
MPLVIPVLMPDKTMPHTVTVQKVYTLTKTVSVTTVVTDVSLVKISPPPVNLVKISELNHGTNVGAQMVTMTMVIMLNVNLVTTNVLPVPMVLVVLPVKPTENKTHQSVHVQPEPMNVVPLVNVAHVTLTVLNVLVLLITVQFVLQKERTTHQAAHVQITLMKSKELVLLVTSDVLLVVVKVLNHLILVVTVKINLIECKMLHFVLAWIITMKLKNSNVKNVTTNVLSVSLPKITVPNVKESESMLQLVNVHMDITLMKTVSVNNVLQNVLNVKTEMLMTVPFVPTIDTITLDPNTPSLKNVHVLMDTSKRMTLVTFVLADV